MKQETSSSSSDDDDDRKPAQVEVGSEEDLTPIKK